MALSTATAEAPSLPPTVEDRAVRATLACVARHGLAKTTFDDVAREAGCARATLYRYFGGKRQLVRITVAREAARIAAAVRDAADAEPTFEGAVVAMIVRAARELRDNEALQFLFAFEPELVRFLPADRTDRAGEWLARVVLTHALSPSSPIDLTDEAAARALVRELVLPGLLASESHVGG